MREAPDLGIPEVKPAIESIRGAWKQKVSPKRRHALVQGRLWSALTVTFDGRGEVGTEWRFYLLPPHEKPSSLVPDVAFVSYERMPEVLGELREKPTIAPDIAVEVLSPEDKRSVLEEKTELYLRNGCKLVIVADPIARTLEMIDESARTLFCKDAIATTIRYPELRIDLSALFAKV